MCVDMGASDRIATNKERESIPPHVRILSQQSNQTSRNSGSGSSI